MMVFDSSFSSLNATVFPEFQVRYLALMGSCYKFPPCATDVPKRNSCEMQSGTTVTGH